MMPLSDEIGQLLLVLGMIEIKFDVLLKAINDEAEALMVPGRVGLNEMRKYNVLTHMAYILQTDIEAFNARCTTESPTAEELKQVLLDIKCTASTFILRVEEWHGAPCEDVVSSYLNLFTARAEAQAKSEMESLLGIYGYFT